MEEAGLHVGTNFKRECRAKKELQFTKQKLQTVTEEKDRIDFDLEELEQYTRKNVLEIHGIRRPKVSYSVLSKRDQ